jgi:hypothetical protein
MNRPPPRSMTGLRSNEPDYSHGDLRSHFVAIQAVRSWVSDGPPDNAPPELASHLDIVQPIPIRRCTGLAHRVQEPATASPGPRVDAALVRTLKPANEWWGKLADGRAGLMEVLARAEGRSPSLITRIVRLDVPAPDIVDPLLRGHQPREISARSLINRPPLPLAWDEQRRVLGFTTPPNP